jgi:peptidoglycan-associated lipoprotein
MPQMVLEVRPYTISSKRILDGARLQLSTNINTKGDEVFPWLDEKGNLYYASNGLPGMGSLDIFRAVREKKGWKEPTILEAPINSGADDFGI